MKGKDILDSKFQTNNCFVRLNRTLGQKAKENGHERDTQKRKRKKKELELELVGGKSVLILGISRSFGVTDEYGTESRRC